MCLLTPDSDLDITGFEQHVLADNVMNLHWDLMLSY